MKISDIRTKNYVIVWSDQEDMDTLLAALPEEEQNPYLISYTLTLFEWLADLLSFPEDCYYEFSQEFRDTVMPLLERDDLDEIIFTTDEDMR